MNAALTRAAEVIARADGFKDVIQAKHSILAEDVLAAVGEPTPEMLAAGYVAKAAGANACEIYKAMHAVMLK
jgi:hypothetical protein